MHQERIITITRETKAAIPHDSLMHLSYFLAHACRGWFFIIDFIFCQAISLWYF